MKKLCLCVIGMVAVVALVAGGIAWANCSNPAGTIELIEAPCAGVAKTTATGLWHNEFKLKRSNSGQELVVFQKNSVTSNLGWFTVSHNGGEDIDLSGGDEEFFLTGGGATDTFHVKCSPSNSTNWRTVALNITPSVGSIVLGWRLAPES